MRVSEMFDFLSSEIFRKKLVIFEFAKKICKKSSEISSEISSNQKPLLWGSKTGVSEYSKLTKVWNLFYTKLSENYKK
jgi:hypothetical protein